MIKTKSVIFVLLLTCISFWSVAQNIDVNVLNLAGKYYQDKEYEKAAELYLKIYESSKQTPYFTAFLNCLMEIKDYARAEKEIKKNLRGRTRSPELLVQYGYVLKLMHREKEATEYYKKALDEVGNQRNEYNTLANEFLNRAEFELAGEVYEQAKRNLPNENFHYELARIYMYQRNYDRMLDEYLLQLKLAENQLPSVEGSIQSAISLDIDGSLNELFRNKIMEALQADPARVVYSRLLIWFLLQEKRFGLALVQQIALDKRLGNEEENVLRLADMAGRNHEYEEAKKAYNYLLSKGSANGWYNRTLSERMSFYYRSFLAQGVFDLQQAKELQQEFETTLTQLGYKAQYYQLIIGYAHLLAFYLRETDKAIELLNHGFTLPGLNMLQQSEIKTELADIQVYKGDEWEAVLLYSQVIEANKTNSLGDEVKLKKARLSYYLGDFKWAQAQLDVIKASTSKLTSNDAFELSMKISDNLSMDTTDVPLKMFSRADLLLFQNQDEQALALLDSILQKYPNHTLNDDIEYSKAKIFIKQGKFQEAANALELLLQKSPDDLLADDAQFQLAEIYQYNLNKPEQARDLYKQLLVEHPGSIYTVESRARFRLLRGDNVEKDVESTEKEKTK